MTSAGVKIFPLFLRKNGDEAVDHINGALTHSHLFITLTHSYSQALVIFFSQEYASMTSVDSVVTKICLAFTHPLQNSKIEFSKFYHQFCSILKWKKEASSFTSRPRRPI